MREADSYLAWAGGARGVEFSADDIEVMDIALALAPDLRAVAAALRHARLHRIEYPCPNPETIAALLREHPLGMIAGHVISDETALSYLVAKEFPIESEPQLASVIYAAMGRCFRHVNLRKQLENFETALNAQNDLE